MFNKTGKQIKTAGKELLSIFKAVSDDIRQEAKLIKEFKDFKKAQLQNPTKPEAEANAHAHEDAQN